MSITKMTELEAVNMMLESIGLTPVNTIDTTDVLEVNLAKDVLSRILRRVQESGWWFNLEQNYPLTPDAGGEIMVPDTALRIDASDTYRDLVERGGKVYDRTNRTYTFDAPVEFDIVWGFNFTELPQVARSFIAAYAAREFAEDQLGEDGVTQKVLRRFAEAESAIHDADADASDYNMLRTRSDLNILDRSL